MRTIVTGGAGFIGSHLTERLLGDGHTVTVIDNFSTGRQENLAHLSGGDGLTVFEGDINGTLSVLEAARHADIQRFVYAASSSCYGIPDDTPTPETAPPRPQYPYALSKHLGEQCVMHWCQLYGLPCVSLRMFNVYGPRSRTSGTYGAVFGVFLAQKLAGEPFTVVGDGTQTRDFTFVTDAVEAIIKYLHQTGWEESKQG